MTENGKRKVTIADDADSNIPPGSQDFIRMNHFSTGRILKVFIGSWNVGNKQPEGLGSFLPAAGEDYDIIAIGLQESTYTLIEEGGGGGGGGHQHQNAAHKAANIVLEACIHRLKQELGNVLGSEYYLVEHVRRAQLQLYIFAKNSLSNAITDVNWSAENTGFLHVFPNKGGLCCTLKVDGTSLAFISCHLTAHEGAKNCVLRNDSTKEILGGVRAGGDKRFDVSVQFHHTFWMGDMNYRLDLGESSDSLNRNHSESLSLGNGNASEHTHSVTTNTSTSTHSGGGTTGSLVKMKQILGSASGHTNAKLTSDGGMATTNASDATLDADDDHAAISTKTAVSDALDSRLEKLRKVLNLIAEEKWSELLEYDELDREMREGRVLGGFTALVPNFPPTFKRIRHRCIHKRSELPEGALTTTATASASTTATATDTVVAHDDPAGKEWCLGSKGNKHLTLPGGGKKKNLKAAVHSGLEAVSGKVHAVTEKVHSVTEKVHSKFEKVSEKVHSKFGAVSDKFRGVAGAGGGPKKDTKKTTSNSKSKESLSITNEDDRDHAASEADPEDTDPDKVVLISDIDPDFEVTDPAVGEREEEEEEEESDSDDDDDDELETFLVTGNRSGNGSIRDTFPASKYFYDKKRIPSYTDRILYRSLAGFSEYLTPLYFESCEHVPSSDHKPVKAGFNLRTIAGEYGTLGGGGGGGGGDDDNVVSGSGKKSGKSSFYPKKKSPVTAAASGTTLELKFSELKGFNLAEMDSQIFGGGSDPYIVITADPAHVLENTVKSTTIKHNLDPDWGKETLTVKFKSADLGGLSRNAHLIVSVWDYDRASADDLIGVFALPLRAILDRANTTSAAAAAATVTSSAYKFREELLCNGDHNGFLEGKVEVVGSIAAVEKSFEKTESEKRSTKEASSPPRDAGKVSDVGRLQQPAQQQLHQHHTNAKCCVMC